MTYAIIIITGIISIFSIPKLFKTGQDFSFKALIVFGLSTIVCIVMVFKQIGDNKTAQYEKDYGELDGSIKSDGKQFPTLMFGGAGFTLGDKTNGRLFQGIDLTVWIEKNRMFVTTTVYDTTNKIIARMEANQWKVNPDNIFDRNSDNNTLEVKDKKGVIVLQVILDQDKAWVHGIFTIQGDKKYKAIVIADAKLYSPELNGGMLVFTNRPDTVTKTAVQIFKYPSNLNMGEKIIKG